MCSVPLMMREEGREQLEDAISDLEDLLDE